jgi:hypothetical protein
MRDLGGVCHLVIESGHQNVPSVFRRGTPLGEGKAVRNTETATFRRV